MQIQFNSPVQRKRVSQSRLEDFTHVYFDVLLLKEKNYVLRVYEWIVTFRIEYSFSIIIRHNNFDFYTIISCNNGYNDSFKVHLLFFIGVAGILFY